STFCATPDHTWTRCRASPSWRATRPSEMRRRCLRSGQVRCLRSLLLGVTLALAVALPLRARANGRPAAAIDITFDPAASRIIVGNTFGGLVSDDGGASWRLICEQVLGTATQVVN